MYLTINGIRCGAARGSIRLMVLTGYPLCSLYCRSSSGDGPYPPPSTLAAIMGTPPGGTLPHTAWAHWERCSDPIPPSNYWRGTHPPVASWRTQKYAPEAEETSHQPSTAPPPTYHTAGTGAGCP